MDLGQEEAPQEKEGQGEKGIMELLFLAYAASIGALNVAAGRKFFGLIGSTQIGRILFAAGAAGIVTFATFGDFWLFVGVAVLLFVWRLGGWGDFFAAIHGKKGYWRSTGDAVWATKISDKIWNIDPRVGMETRLKATLDMAIRHILIVPVVVFFALMTGDWNAAVTALAFPLMGGAYFLGGFPGEHKYSVAVAEFLCGVIIAAMLWSY